MYPVSLGQRLYALFLYPVLTVLALAILLRFLSHTDSFGALPVSFSDIFVSLLMSTGRIFAAYFFAVIVALPLAVLAASGKIAEKIFLPIFDIIECVPTLAFFPILIVFFVQYGYINGAAIFILFLSMVWEIVFTLVGGLKIIPSDIQDVSKVFHLNPLQRFFRVTLPAIFPQFITGSILAMAQGWNLVIVAEVLHVYIPHGSGVTDLRGIGSLLVNASAAGQNSLFVAALLFIILAIGFLNFFVWQKLLHYAQRFRFE
jgi:NitT/TauT family transport system permease protein